MDTRMIDQNSPDWDKIRLGRFTASEVYKLMFSSKPTDGARTYVKTIVGEIISGMADTSTCSNFDHGHEKEGDAVILYMRNTKRLCTKTGFWCYGDHAGASPDRLVGDTGLLEVKCPVKSWRMVHWIENSRPDRLKKDKDGKKYYWQIMMQLLCTYRKWVDFVVYFDGWAGGAYGLKVTRIHRNEQDITLLKERLSWAITEKKKYLKLILG